MQNSAPSDQQQQVETNNGQVEKTLDASSSETQARVGPSVTSIPSATPKQILAIEQFYEFNKHLSIKMYAAVMKSHFSSEHARSNKEFLEAMSALGPLTSKTAMRVLELPFCEFFHRVGVIKARKEAGHLKEDFCDDILTLNCPDLVHCTFVKVVLKDIGSEGLWPQLVYCAPFPSIALYFRILYLSYPKVRVVSYSYLKIRISIIYLSEGKDSIVFLSG